MPSYTPLVKPSHPIRGEVLLWCAILIFGASSAVTRKITELGAQHFVGGQNPISLCNVLFVGNLCALFVFGLIYRRQWTWRRLRQFSKREWISLVTVAILAGALAPSFIFQALASTPVTNVVLISRLEPPLTLALSIWLLHDRVNRWEMIGAIVSFIGVALTLFLQPAQPSVMLGVGESLAILSAITLAISTILSKKRLSRIPLGIYSIVRTGLGTIVFFCTALALYGSDHFMGVFSPFLWQWMLLYGVIIVVVGQSFWVAGQRAASVSTASIIGSFTPIAGILAAFLILGEIPTQAQYIGGSVILLGLVLSHVGVHRQIRSAIEVEANTGFKGI